MMLRSQKTRHCKGRPTTESGTHSTAPFLRNGGGKPNADLTPSSPESSNTAEVGEAILAPFHNPQWEGNPRPHLSPRGEKRSGLAQMFAVFSTEHMRERERERDLPTMHSKTRDAHVAHQFPLQSAMPSWAADIRG
jgi:hypothetical protein